MKRGREKKGKGRREKKKEAGLRLLSQLVPSPQRSTPGKREGKG